tara:strand:+ start:84988 stop:85200 length:213 start_codon:yes stop_codon:yes gene_type:complete
MNPLVVAIIVDGNDGGSSLSTPAVDQPIEYVRAGWRSHANFCGRTTVNVFHGTGQHRQLADDCDTGPLES